MQEKNQSGMTLLHFIAGSEHKIDWLDIEYYKYSKEDIVRTDLNGNTPLHYAAYQGNKVFLKKICSEFNKEVDFKGLLLMIKELHHCIWLFRETKTIVW